ncbi:unnamed protein product [Tilletia controversa]|nr:unnamed protein product [Tilletia controversa]
MTELKAAWDDLKTDGERMQTTMEAVKKWELDSSRANKIESVREALAEHERRALKLTVQAEESKGICSIVIVTHPHPEVNGFIVATSHTERVAKRCVTRSRNLAKLVSYFDSYVRWNPPRSMRLPDEHREADDGDDSDEVQDPEEEEEARDTRPEEESEEGDADEDAEDADGSLRRRKRQRGTGSSDDVRPRTDKDSADADLNVRQYLLGAVGECIDRLKSRAAMDNGW